METQVNCRHAYPSRIGQLPIGPEVLYIYKSFFFVKTRKMEILNVFGQTICMIHYTSLWNNQFLKMSPPTPTKN